MRYNINFVVEQDLPEDQYPRIKAATGYNIKCPFCGKKIFNINPLNSTARCPKCGNGEDPTKGFSSVSLHAKLTGLALEEAKEDLEKRWKGLPSNVQIKFKQQPVPKKKQEIMPSSLRDGFYRTFLDQLILEEKDKKDLLRRGLDEQTIKKIGFKSLNNKQQNVAERTVENLSDEEKKYIRDDFKRLNLRYKVPGFAKLFRKSVKPEISLPQDDGYLIPVRNIMGLIEGFQIRHEKGDAKYTWLSSSYMEDGIGVSDINNIQHSGFEKYIKTGEKLPSKIYLTEGALKAEVASFLLKRPFIGLTGVGNTSKLPEDLETLKRMGVEEVYIAIDMDYRSKKEVAAALKKIISIIRESGLKCHLVNWNEKFKGIDDAALARRKGEKISFAVSTIS